VNRLYLGDPTAQAQNLPNFCRVRQAAPEKLSELLVLLFPGQGPGGFAIENVLASVKDQLSLNTSQQVMWDNAVASTKAARDTGRTHMEKAHAALTAELAKAEPDFAAVAAAGDAAQAGNQALRKQVRDQWLALYATFTPAQKSVVRDAVKARVDRMESFRAQMQQRRQEKGQSAN